MILNLTGKLGVAGSLCFTTNVYMYYDIPIRDKLSVTSRGLNESILKFTISLISTCVHDV